MPSVITSLRPRPLEFPITHYNATGTLRVLSANRVELEIQRNEFTVDYEVRAILVRDNPESYFRTERLDGRRRDNGAGLTPAARRELVGALPRMIPNLLSALPPGTLERAEAEHHLEDVDGTAALIQALNLRAANIHEVAERDVAARLQRAEESAQRLLAEAEEQIAAIRRRADAQVERARALAAKHAEERRERAQRLIGDLHESRDAIAERFREANSF